MDVLEKADERTLAEMKEWLFKENIRIAEERERLDKERKDFEDEKRSAMMKLEQKQSVQEIKKRRIDMEQQLVARKLAMLEDEYIRLSKEKQKFEQEKMTYEKIRKFSRPVSHVTYIGTDFLFQGVDNEIALKKRYRDLLKIFHPDNLNGDTAVIQNINKEYDFLKKMYG